MQNSRDTFGELSGVSISNKDTILQEIDNKLGRKSCLEYIITYPIGYITLPFGLGSITYNFYGHSVLMFKNLDGQYVIVNIEAKEVGKPFIKYYDPKEYLYGTNPETCGAQRGVYNRNMVGIRVYGVKPEDMQDMIDHIENLIQMENKKIKFNIVLGPILNIFKTIFPTLNLPEFGNCSKWTSTMLQKAKVIDNTFVWPRTIFIDIFESAHKRGFETDVVFYEQPSNVKNLTLGVKAKPIWFEGVAPFQLTRNWMYRDLKRFSNIIVDSNTKTAIIKKQENVLKPNEFRNILNNKFVICANVTCSMYLTYRGFQFIKRFIKK
jgi:hypothetical protein